MANLKEKMQSLVNFLKACQFSDFQLRESIDSIKASCMGLFEVLDNLRGNRVAINNKNNRSASLSGRNNSTEATATVKIKTMMTKIQIKMISLKVISDEQDVDPDDSDDSQSEESNLVDDDDDEDDDNDIVVFHKTRRGQCCATNRTEFLLLVNR